MIAMRIGYGCAGALIFGLVLAAVRAGSYPIRGGRITRAEDPLAFWVLMAIGVIFGTIFLLFSLFGLFSPGYLLRM